MFVFPSFLFFFLLFPANFYTPPYLHFLLLLLGLTCGQVALLSSALLLLSWYSMFRLMQREQKVCPQLATDTGVSKNSPQMAHLQASSSVSSSFHPALVHCSGSSSSASTPSYMVRAPKVSLLSSLFSLLLLLLSFSSRRSLRRISRQKS